LRGRKRILEAEVADDHLESFGSFVGR
jgi:hypothetical protein